MKKILAAGGMLLAVVVAVAQNPTVTINTTGNRNKQVIVDGTNYTIDNRNVSDEQVVTITDLAVGQHTLELVRSNQYNNRNTSTKSTFQLRSGYDLAISVSANGSITSKETRIDKNNDGEVAHLNNAGFNKIYNQARTKSSSTTRASYLENEFNTIKKSMSAQQAAKLIQLVNTESLRLKLAKLAYVHVYDRENYTAVSNLLSSSYNRNELATYIATIPGDEEEVAETGTPMNDAKFKLIYQEVTNESSMNDRVYYLTNFFSRDYNYYTADQVKQLIGLVSAEQDRLTLAKSAYRGVVDRENFGTVYQLLSNPSSRTALVTYVNSYDNSNPRPALSLADFNKLYQSVYNQYSSTARYNAIKTAFTTTGNYFSVQQAKKLIPLVSNDANRLELSKLVYKVLVDRDNYAEFNEFLSTSSRTNLNAYVSTYDNLYIGNGVAMSETDFNSLYKSISNSWSSSTRYNQLADAFRKTTNYFTVYQARQLINLVSSESDRLVLAKNAYDNIVDPNNYAQLYDLFANSGNRNDLADFVAGMQSGNTTVVKIPMSETEFNNTYREIQLTFGLGAKFNSLSTLFNTETNYFTVAQAKQLIQLVSAESNRLELAKAAYDNVTDPANFSQLYDLLSSQSSRNELMNYINSNASINQ